MAVYTELSQGEIQAFLHSYNLAPLRLAEGIRAGVQNTNYCITLEDNTKLILTVFETRVNETDLPFFMGLMEHLALHKVSCPMPLRAKNGQIIQQVKNKPASLVTFLEGRSVTSIQNPHMSELGAAMARLHLAGQSYTLTRANTLSLAGWKELYAKIGSRADEIIPGLAQEIDSEIKALEMAWPRDLPHGVIHADLFPDNVFYNDDNQLTGIIDFYFACNDILSYELAICLNAWCFEKHSEFNITKAKLMLRAYHDVRPISEAELEALPVLARGAALRFLLTRAHDWLFPVKGALVTQKDPMEYVKKLRFHRSVTHHSQYGL